VKRKNQGWGEFGGKDKDAIGERARAISNKRKEVYPQYEGENEMEKGRKFQGGLGSSMRWGRFPSHRLP